MQAIQDFFCNLDYNLIGTLFVVKVALVVFFWNHFKGKKKQPVSVQPAAPPPTGMPSEIIPLTQNFDQLATDNKCACCNDDLEEDTISHDAVGDFVDTKHCASCSEYCLRCSPTDYTIKLTESMLAATGWRLGYVKDCIVNESLELSVLETGSVHIWRKDLSRKHQPELEFLTEIDKKFIASKYEESRKNIFAGKFKAPEVKHSSAPPSSEQRAADFSSCYSCGFTKDEESSVMSRSDLKIYCNDCWLKKTGNHPTQIEAINKLGYFTAMSMDDFKKWGGKKPNHYPVSLPITTFEWIALYEWVEGKEVAVRTKGTTEEPIFVFKQHPAGADVTFICDILKARELWRIKHPSEYKTPLSTWTHETPPKAIWIILA